MRPADRPRLNGRFIPRRANFSLCAYSGCEEDHMTGHRMCAPHREWENAYRMRYRAGRVRERGNMARKRAWRGKQARAGLCLSCGTDAVANRVRCQRCLDRRARVESERRGRLILLQHALGGT